MHPIDERIAKLHNAIAWCEKKRQVCDRLIEATRGHEVRIFVAAGICLRLDYMCDAPSDSLALRRDLAAAGFRLKDGTVNTHADDLPEISYTLSDGENSVQLWLQLTGNKCRRVECGSQPKYKIVCDEPIEAV